jgi:hypothetical protein
MQDRLPMRNDLGYECMLVVARCVYTLAGKASLLAHRMCRLSQQKTLSSEKATHQFQNLNNFANQNEFFFDDDDDDNGQCHCSVNFLSISTQKQAKRFAPLERACKD